ncbi:hypothetical protein, partial [Falsiroseomonas sp.]|uniref:hypothetical protein n=1 Tax=Falsiroseomonas sp. TaxID=2870721 RepID=UPI00271B2179
LGASALAAAALVAVPSQAQAQRHGGWGGPNQAINQCTRAAQAEARRYGRFAQVTEIRGVSNTRWGYRVRGRIVVEQPRGFRNRINRGNFDCRVDRGRITQLRLSGLGNFR